QKVRSAAARLWWGVRREGRRGLRRPEAEGLQRSGCACVTSRKQRRACPRCSKRNPIALAALFLAAMLAAAIPIARRRAAGLTALPCFAPAGEWRQRLGLHREEQAAGDRRGLFELHFDFLAELIARAGLFADQRMRGLVVKPAFVA